MLMSIIASVVSVHFLCAHVVMTSSLGDGVARRLHEFADDGLGVAEFQRYLDQNVTFESQLLNGTELAAQVGEAMSLQLKTKIDALFEMKTAIEAAYNRTSTRNPFQDCCTISLNQESDILNTVVNLDELCTTGQGLRLGANLFLPESINEAIKLQYNKALGIKYAYFGSEEGVMFNYPSIKTCDKTYDPRFRPWYVETATPQPKDLVLVLDRSGSMGETYRGRKLVSIAVDAATTVLSTLNPNDRVGIVTFSTGAVTPSGSDDTSICYADKMAIASAQNKDYLKGFIAGMGAGGSTHYKKALNKAFDYFHNIPATNTYDNRARVKVILFLTDGQPTDSNQTGILQVVADRNAHFGNQIIILTYGLGNDVGSGVLRAMAAQSKNNPEHGPILAGIYTHITDPDNLRLSMASYYDHFKETDTANVLFTVPFIDAFGSGLTEAMCLPVRYQDRLKGVACMELSVDDMLSEITYFREAEKSYAFIVDKTARVLFHPLLSLPADVTNNPYFIYLNTIEHVSGIDGIIQSMISGSSGTLMTTGRRVVPRGDVALEGVNVQLQLQTYSWFPVAGTGFSLCLVIPEEGYKSQIVWSGQYPDILYHRLDLSLQLLNKCHQFSRAVVIDDTSLFCSPRTFQRPFKYLYTDEYVHDIIRYESYLTNNTDVNPGFKEGIREIVAATAIFNNITLARRDYNLKTVWRYVGMENGIHRTFPASETPKNYDPTKRTWYLRAKASSGKITISAPYKDAFGAGLVVTLSQVLYEGSTSLEHSATDPVFGVMGVDFTLQYFYYLVTDSAADCEQYSCFVLDDAGYIIVHKDWLTGKQSSTQVTNVHITVYETDIAKLLIDKQIMKLEGCVNIETLNRQLYWRVSVSKDDPIQEQTFDLHTVPNTNMYLVVAKKSSSQRLQCCEVEYSHVNCDDIVSYQCLSPCYMSADIYNYCQGQFQFSEDGLPQCAPPIPKVDFDKLIEKERLASSNDIPDCYSYNCESMTTAKTCASVIGCGWCLFDSDGTQLESPHCKQSCFSQQNFPTTKCLGASSWRMMIGVTLGVFYFTWFIFGCCVLCKKT